jgi:hypothetical protein
MVRGKEDLSTRLALEQAQKSAEALFETKSIADIKRVGLACCFSSNLGPFNAFKIDT